MIKPIVKDVLFLGEKSTMATKDDIQVVNDLIDTLRANLDGCVGMAANMIGVKKNIIVFAMGEMIVPMINPVIIKKENSYMTEESCLSLEGFRQTKRYETIEVEYFDKNYNLTDKDNAYYVRIEEYNSKNYLIKCDVEELFDNE